MDDNQKISANATLKAMARLAHKITMARTIATNAGDIASAKALFEIGNEYRRVRLAIEKIWFDNEEVNNGSTVK